MVTGATMANFTALAAARQWWGEKHGLNAARDGIAGGQPVPVFSSGFIHASAIKAFGIGLGTAVVVDAAVIRTLLVPAAMRLMGRWNWWAPAPLARLHARLSLAERSEEARPAAATAPLNAAE